MLGVAPWDLMEQPVFWIAWALQYERVDIETKHQMYLKARAGGGHTGNLG